MEENTIYSKFVLSDIFNCITNKTSEKEIKSLNHEYYDFMEKYHKEHAVCPKCGSLVVKRVMKNGEKLECSNRSCDYKADVTHEEEKSDV